MSEGGDSDWESAVEAVSEGVRALKPPSSGRIVAQDGSGLNPPTRSHTRSPADGGARVRSPSPLGEAATSSTNVGGGSFCDPRADAASKAWIDPFLREALEGGGDARMAVLRVDAEVCGFARDDARASHEFAGNGYQRMIAHKVAAHHGLTSRSVVGADGQDRALIEKESGVSSTMDPPVVNLADVRGDTDESVKGDKKKKKVTVTKRGGGWRGGGNNGGPRAGHRKSSGPKRRVVNEKEAEYADGRLAGYEIAESSSGIFDGSGEDTGGGGRYSREYEEGLRGGDTGDEGHGVAPRPRLRMTLAPDVELIAGVQATTFANGAPVVRRWCYRARDLRVCRTF